MNDVMIRRYRRRSLAHLAIFVGLVLIVATLRSWWWLALLIAPIALSSVGWLLSTLGWYAERRLSSDHARA